MKLKGKIEKIMYWKKKFNRREIKKYKAFVEPDADKPIVDRKPRRGKRKHYRLTGWTDWGNAWNKLLDIDKVEKTELKDEFNYNEDKNVINYYETLKQAQDAFEGLKNRTIYCSEQYQGLKIQILKNKRWVDYTPEETEKCGEK